MQVGAAENALEKERGDVSNINRLINVMPFDCVEFRVLQHIYNSKCQQRLNQNRRQKVVNRGLYACAGGVYD